MQQPAIEPIVGTASNTAIQERRKLWIMTGYGVSFLAVCGVLAYYFSAYITH